MLGVHQYKPRLMSDSGASVTAAPFATLPTLPPSSIEAPFGLPG